MTRPRGYRSELSNQVYDVIVVGAGPAGSWTAYELASSGHSVAVFEEKSGPGVNVCCTGIISTECFDSLGIGPDVILTAANSARFLSPSGRCLRLQTERVQAYVVDRSLVDRVLASKAQSRGAQYFLSSRVTDVIPGRDQMQIEALCCGVRELFTARAVVLANGYRPGLTRRLGLSSIKSFLVGAQAEVELNDIDEVEVHFGREVAPGSFAWLVPISANRAYVGLLAASRARLHLQRFVDNLFHRGRIGDQKVEIREKAIPLGTPARSYGDRVLAIGDAAGHVKPTTGGGIYFGHLGARLAAGVLHEALRADNLADQWLARYQKLWKAKMGKELSRGYLARRLYARLSDRQIEGVFSVAESTGMAEALVRSGDFSFDWHSGLALAALRRSSAYPWLRIRNFITREATS